MGELEVFGAGHLDVLAIGRGHLRLTVPEGDALEREKAGRIVEDMLRRGYAIFVETEGGTERVRAFDPERFVYLIDDTMDTTRAEPRGTTDTTDVHLPPTDDELKCAECGRAFPRRPGPGAQRKRCPDCAASKKLGRPVTGVPVDRAKATAVGRVAGG